MNMHIYALFTSMWLSKYVWHIVWDPILFG